MFLSSLPNQYRHEFSQRSTFDTVFTSEKLGWRGISVKRILTSPGYNVSPLPQHLIGLHLGKPVRIIHRRDTLEQLHHFEAGDIVFTPAGIPVEYAHPQTVDALYIWIDPQLVTHTAEAIGLKIQTVELQDNLGTRDVVLKRIGHEFIQELMSPGLGGQLYIDALTNQLLIHLLRRYSGRSIENDPGQHDITTHRLRPAIDYIQAHLSADLALEDIAASVYLSPYHFSRLFKKTFGVSPHQYVIRQRIEAAKRLLQNPDLTLAEIAARVGFADHSHLTRHFKRLTGTTPRTQ